MIAFYDPSEVPPDFGPSIVAIGKFDGVHAGHRAVLERVRADAEAAGARSVAVTFDRHPLAVVQPDICPAALTSVQQKVELLAETGIDATLVLHFDEALAVLTPAEFTRIFLVDALRAQTVLVGRDFQFGRRGVGDPAALRALGLEWGFDVEVVDDVRSIGAERRVSSTWIREVLAAGDVQTAARLLGRPASVRGEVVHGLKRGRELGFPTANLSAEVEGFVPADGVYAGWLVDEGAADGARHPAAISIGVNPHFDDVAVRQVEAYVLGETDLDLYGHRVELQFVRRIRGMAAFDGVDALIDQIADDVRRVGEALSEPDPLEGGR